MTNQSSTLLDEQPTRNREGGRVVLVVLAVLALLLAGGYVAAYSIAGDNVPRGTTVAGVNIGGVSEDRAAEVLEEGLADRLQQRIPVRVGDRALSVGAARAGLSVDYEASVVEAGGEKSWDPRRLWDYYTAGNELEPVVEVDDTKLARVAERLERQVGTPAKNGAVSFRNGRVVTRPAELGTSVDTSELETQLVDTWLGQQQEAELGLLEVEPEVDSADVEEAVDGFANPAVSAPVMLVFGDSEVQLSPRRYARALSMKAEKGELVPALDQDVLLPILDNSVNTDAPEDATVRLVNGRPQVVPGEPGIRYDTKAVASAFLDLVTKSGEQRRMKVKSSVAKPEFTVADARKLGIKERVSSFTTYYPPAEYRDTNIGRAAELIDGTVLKPGETFSLNDTVGERTEANGFTKGFIINDGIFKEDLGGGVSQMATTLFNAMFFAGLKDIEHKPHSFYIDRYPVGREATVAWGAVDLRFQNDTPYGVLIDANVIPSAGRSQGTVTVTMWSTKYWDISSATSQRYNFTSPQTRTLSTPDCYPNQGYGGFDVDVTRTFRRQGSSEVVRNETFHTTYIPSDTVICT